MINQSQGAILAFSFFFAAPMVAGMKTNGHITMIADRITGARTHALLLDLSRL
ncbi:hypothetical protein [Roseovarius sp. ZX-A-9]|uniref:hypothetical protein n=1 Tax=Roseovarius sp. ZX-A-9 TaxID=3014783 RepID=UPI00232B1708|nr:hypothetical protein [Roseovarius sp. ZX-A-9]MDX1786134.1 hypothetical protein [Roseovarius sp.]